MAQSAHRGVVCGKQLAAKLKEVMRSVERARAACEKHLQTINAKAQSIQGKTFTGQM